ncbi:Hypothetical protein SRAE_2000187200 [Strongyloides ratti]|uniref:Uncharacterized protein n=1 Tax=Strongyloides ratti TaxID=34506 RepID=A0A090LBV6_STRRB|nr:Hypothetical protein SRAE_2000187200 [Strongyloides ratti]CEF67207.1 Hypothetical protein SRAE_2000187200 [Strongyloides ratti]
MNTNLRAIWKYRHHLKVTRKYIFNILFNVTIEINNILKYMNRSVIGIFMFEKVIKKTLVLEKELNDLVTKVELLNDCETKAFLIRRLSNIRNIFQIILKNQHELERNSILKEHYFSIKNKLLDLINSDDRDDKSFLECLDEKKKFEKNLFVMGRYVDVDIKESLQYLVGLFYLKWEKLQNFIEQKERLLTSFELQVEEYFLNTSNNNDGNLIFILGKLLKLKNDIKIELLITRKIIFFPEIEVINSNFQQIFLKTISLIRKIEKNIGCSTKGAVEINELKSLAGFEKSVDNACVSLLQTKNDSNNSDLKMNYFQELKGKLNVEWIKSSSQAVCYFFFTLISSTLFLLFIFHTFNNYIQTYGCHIRDFFIIEKKQNYMNYF